MKIDVSDLLKKKITKKDVNLTIEKNEFFNGEESIRFVEPVKLEGKFNLVGDILNLDGTATTKLELTCSRCLEKFVRDIKIEIHEEFSNENVNKDDDCIFIDSDAIDITEIIENNIILALPIRKLCSEDCKGLCQVCGANLNNSNCNCEKQDIDPRLAGLKDFFSSN